MVRLARDSEIQVSQSLRMLSHFLERLGHEDAKLDFSAFDALLNPSSASSMLAEK